MSCEEGMENAKSLLRQLMATHQQIMELHTQSWLSRSARVRLWSLNREERSLHLQWARTEDAALSALKEAQVGRE